MRSTRTAPFTTSVRTAILRRDCWWPVVIAALIFVASSRTQVVSPGITKVDDKFGHFAVYGLLGTLVCRLSRGWRGAIGSLAIVAAYGASDEFHQSFVPGRSSDVRDWYADVTGAAIAIALYTGWPWYRQLLERRVRLGHPRREES